MANLQRPTKSVVATVSSELWLITGYTHRQQTNGEDQSCNVVTDESDDRYYNGVPGHISQSHYTTAVGADFSPPVYRALEDLDLEDEGKEHRFIVHSRVIRCF